MKKIRTLLAIFMVASLSLGYPAMMAPGQHSYLAIPLLMQKMKNRM